MWTAFIFAFVFSVAFSDLLWRKIPAGLTLTASIGGILFHLFSGGIVTAAVAGAIGFTVGLALFQLGAIGGGDAKLIAALGFVLGLSQWLRAMEMAIIVAAIFALAQIIKRRAFRQTLCNMREILRGVARHGIAPHPIIHAGNPQAIRAPFGVAAAIGTVLAVLPW